MVGGVMWDVVLGTGVVILRPRKEREENLREDDTELWPSLGGQISQTWNPLHFLYEKIA